MTSPEDTSGFPALGSDNTGGLTRHPGDRLTDVTLEPGDTNSFPVLDADSTAGFDALPEGFTPLPMPDEKEYRTGLPDPHLYQPGPPPTLGTDPTAGLEALRAYTAEPEMTATQKRSEASSNIQLIIGLVLLAGATVSTFASGNIIFGIFLLVFLVFGIALVAQGVSDRKSRRDGTKEPNAVRQLREAGKLDEAVTDFPLQPSVENDSGRFGNHYVFRKHPQRCLGYDEFTRVYVQEDQAGGETIIRSLKEDLAGGDVTLCYLPLDDEGMALARTLIARIRRANPQVRIG